jgi:hypothetical protein
MVRKDGHASTRYLPLMLVIVIFPAVSAHADAILPSLVLIWPITILLLIPIVVVEALYAKSRLLMGFWESVRVIGLANLLSAIAGLPIANLFSAGVQRVLEAIYFRGLGKLNRDIANGLVAGNGITRHDYSGLVFLGLYPRWILLVSAVTMVALCFLVSWWVEAKWVERYLQRRASYSTAQNIPIWATIRNANLLSYSFVVLTVLGLFVALWPKR